MGVKVNLIAQETSSHKGESLDWTKRNNQQQRNNWTKRTNRTNETIRLNTSRINEM